MYDVFICHASEDKKTVVSPMVEGLKGANITCWVDEGEIEWGDSLTQKVNEGLQKSKYVIVVLSEAFISKNWPQRELNAVLNIEATTGEVKVLPLISGDHNQILMQFPLLNDKLHLRWNGNVQPITDALQKRLKKAPTKAQKTKTTTTHQEDPSIYVPKIKKKVTQRNKDLFIKKAFQDIQNYFKKALSALAESDEDIETDFTLESQSTFTCKVYLQGNVKCKCKIWLGGFGASETISYSEDINLSNTSMNDWLSVNEDNGKLSLKSSGMGDYSSRGQAHNEQQAAAYLWKRFVQRLEY